MTEIRVEHLDSTVRALDAIGDYIEDPADALDQVADEGLRVVRSRIPRLTGAMADGADSTRNGGDVSTFVPATYAPAINSGVPSRNIAPAHFIEDGARDLAPKAVQLLEDGINRKIREQGLST